jgi:hypothetical protein
MDWTTSTASATQASRSLDAAMTNVTSTRRLARSHSALLVHRRGSSSDGALNLRCYGRSVGSPAHEGGSVRDPGGSKASGREIANADERRDQLSGVRAMPHDEDERPTREDKDYGQTIFTREAVPLPRWLQGRKKKSR